MASKEKRFRNDSENFFYSSEESEDGSSNGETQNDENDHLDVQMRRYQSRRKPKCFSKNAQMARENRLKKKIYVAKLEKEVDFLKKEKSKLTSVIDNQSFMLNELKNEVKYLKGVLANSSDISKLLKTIHQGTGMPVSSSLDNSRRVTNTCTNRSVPVARKTMHPWEENPCSSPPSDEFSDEHCDNLNFECPLNSEYDLSPFLMDETDMPIGLEVNDEYQIKDTSFEEHNYTRDLTSRNLEELLIFLPLLYHHSKSLRHLVNEIEVARLSIV